MVMEPCMKSGHWVNKDTGLCTICGRNLAEREQAAIELMVDLETQQQAIDLTRSILK